jgi:hypothetical protein
MLAPKPTYYLLLFLCISSFSLAQTGFKGKIIDSTEKKLLSNAVVTVLRTKDSVLVKFTRSDKNGSYLLQNIEPGKYIVEVSYPGYASFADVIECKPGTLTDIPAINIIPKSKLLQEIIIQQKVSAIRIKGDTTEYKADSFKVGPNASVQDLLKKLPGLQVNSKGEITAQGQKVEKILVDDEEFFSDDPAVVSQNLRADVVDKVQVFDKKSEQAEFTGVDDGQKTKTINLEIKEDKKKGYFGKIEAGTDFGRYRNIKGMINSFKKKQKIAAYATNNNTSFQGLNWNEQRNFGSNDFNMQMNEDGDMMFWSEGDDFSQGQGLPGSTTAGISYINKWNKDKQSINSSLQFNDQDINGRNESITKTILPDTSFTNTTAETFRSFRDRKKVNVVFDWQLDSSSSMKLKAAGSLINSRRQTNFNGSSISEENAIINTTSRSVSNDAENRDFTSELAWKKKFKKTGHTLSITGNFSNNAKSGTGLLLADNTFFGKTGNTVAQQTIDQQRINDENRQTVQSAVVYTEPLAKKLFLELNYRNNFNRNNSLQNTFEKDGSGNGYNRLLDSLSNDFRFRTTDHNGGFSVRFVQKKYTISAGVAAGRTRFGVDELRKNTQRSAVFTNLLPKASIKFTPKKQRSITLSYTGVTQNPTLQQINPIINNIDPVNITIGNENLKQAFRHTISFNASDYKIIKSRSFYAFGDFSFVNNDITNANTVDTLGRRINQSVNVNGNYNGSVYAAYSFDIGKGLNMNIYTQNQINQNINFINGFRNVNNNYMASIAIGLYKWNDKPLNFGISIRPGRNFSRSSINPNIVTKFWQLNSHPSIEWKLKKQKLFIEIDGNFTLYQRTGVFQNQRNVFLINGSIKRTFTKTDAFELKLSVNDLLNQNIGIQRNVTSNFIQENTFQNLRRFFLLSLTWNFNKNGKPVNNF